MPVTGKESPVHPRDYITNTQSTHFNFPYMIKQQAGLCYSRSLHRLPNPAQLKINK